jgi:hypothetical protein
MYTIYCINPNKAGICGRKPEKSKKATDSSIASGGKSAQHGYFAWGRTKKNKEASQRSARSW